MLPLKTAISDTYPNPSNAVARAGFAALWDAINEFQQKSELDVASAATCDIGAQLSTKLHVTGTTGITSFGTNYRGPIQLRFAGAVTLTHNATTLRCPGSANITTTAGDILIAYPTATTSGTLDGWQVAILARGAGEGSFPVAVSMGSTLAVAGAITPSQTAGIIGTTTNNSANAGSVGEVISSTVTSGSAVALTTSVEKNITSISLTAGDWDVYGGVIFIPAATTNITNLQGSASQTSATSDSIARFIDIVPSGYVPGATPVGYAVPAQRISLSGAATVYLVAVSAFTVSTMAAYGRIWARRAR